MTDKTTTTTIQALLPCPFCSGEAEMQEEDTPHLYWVGCNVCGCATDTAWKPEDVANDWNRRAAPSPAPAAPSAAQADALASTSGLRDVDPLTFTYTNWRGETAVRRARPIRVYHGATEWHPEPQWLMEAYDADKGGLRAFAVKDMVFGAQPAQGGSVSEAAECRRILEEMTALFEMDDEANEPGTDSYTVLKQAREFLSAARAAQPVVEVVDRLSRIRDLAAEMGHADTLGFEEARERIIEEVDAALRSGEVR